MTQMFEDVRVGAFAQYLIKTHINRAFATSSTLSARHNAERLMQSELTDLIGQATTTYNLEPWKTRQEIQNGRRVPYLQVDRSGQPVRETLYGIYRPDEGMYLSCEGLTIESDALPLTLYTALLSRLSEIGEPGVFVCPDKPRLSQLIDLSIPGYDPIVTGYEMKAIFGDDMVDMKTEQGFVRWPEFRDSMEKMIEGREGRPYD
tara:strand:- start:9848 stop:10459 length:612 start_codon:yes stop_codon:yes gene_type:complete